MDGNFAAVLVALTTGIPASIAAIATLRTHREVRTNHGIRNGQRIEDLGDDMAFVRRTMVTKLELSEHAEHDVEVARELAAHVEDTKQELLAAIHGEKE